MCERSISRQVGRKDQSRQNCQCWAVGPDTSHWPPRRCPVGKGHLDPLASGQLAGHRVHWRPQPDGRPPGPSSPPDRGSAGAPAGIGHVDGERCGQPLEDVAFPQLARSSYTSRGKA